MTDFRNEPLLELRRLGARAELEEELDRIDATLPLAVPVRVAGDARYADDHTSVDPGDPDRVVATFAESSAADVDAAVEAAAASASDWGRLEASARAEVLHRAAAELRRDRLALAALEVRECAKPWPDADADVCEAIDFLDYYAEQAEALAAGGSLVQLPGERNQIAYRPRGVVAVIAPWNFPIAIATGMVAAALAVGNGVILKPAEQSPACAEALFTALQRAGLPSGAFSLLPGMGEVGAALVRHPGVDMIAFTGSGPVGVDILRAAAETGLAGGRIKHVIAELGGKNVIIVDADADLDDAVPAIAQSAFGFAGQKCSAASRVMVHEALAEGLAERMAGAVDSLQVGQAGSFSTDVPPLIDADARDRVRGLTERAEAAGHRVAAAEIPAGDGYFVPPTLVGGLPADAELLETEVFGPLLSVETVGSVEEACARVEALPYALTGGLFSRNPDTVRRVIELSPVGNLYINRHITGAMVARQPFGGHRLSGTGAKAGGPDYILQFCSAHVSTENTMRHGVVV